MTETGNANEMLSVRPADPPRPFTARARWRSWGEPRVRTWWVTGLALFLLTVYFVGVQVYGSVRDWWLVQHGLRVDADIVEAEGNPIRNKLYGPELNMRFKLSVKVPGRQPFTIYDRLKDQREPLGPGMTIALFIDPNDPSRWTDRKAISFGNDALLGVVTIPVILAMIVVASILRLRVLRVWRDGQAMAAIVMKTSHSALAPLSWSVLLARRDSRDKRVFSTIIPGRAGELAPGDVVWVVAPPHRPERAIVAGLYQ